MEAPNTPKSTYAYTFNPAGYRTILGAAVPATRTTDATTTYVIALGRGTKSHLVRTDSVTDSVAICGTSGLGVGGAGYTKFTAEQAGVDCKRCQAKAQVGK